MGYFAHTPAKTGKEIQAARKEPPVSTEILNVGFGFPE